MSHSVIIIDGNDFSEFSGFIAAFNAACDKSYPNDVPFNWRGNLDAFRDYICLTDRVEIVWKNANLSRLHLGHGAHEKRLKSILKTCHPSNVPRIKAGIAQARNRKGPTLFDVILEIVSTLDGQTSLILK